MVKHFLFVPFVQFVVSSSADNSFVNDFRMFSEVNKQTEFESGCFQVIVNLCAM